MSFETKQLRQYAVYWPYTGRDNDGLETVGDPVEIRCRWESGKTDILDAFGTKITVDHVVFPDREIAEGSRLWLGKLTDYTAGSVGICDVKVSKKDPGLKARTHSYRLGLVKSASRGA